MALLDTRSVKGSGGVADEPSWSGDGIECDVWMLAEFLPEPAF